MNFTRILEQIGGAGDQVDDVAIAALYGEIRRLARHCMRRENAAHTLAPTALANEAWLRLFGAQKATFGNSVEFFAAAATTLRRILIEHGRSRSRHKRGGDRHRVDLEAAELAAPESDPLLDLDGALERLAALDPLKARLVELRFFVGLSIPETAELLGMSERTAAREWRLARAFLQASLGAGGDR